MTGITNQYHPDYAIHPGEYLNEVLESRGIKKREFAQRIGLTTKAVSQIINGKTLYSPDVALMLEKTLGISARIWMNLAESYQLFKAREKERKNLETERTKRWLKNFPLTELRQMGILPSERKPEVVADALLRFLGVSKPEVWDLYNATRAVAYRKSDKFAASSEATAVWLHLAEKKASLIETAAYERDSFTAALEKIRSLTLREPKDFFPQLVELCRAAGVALVIVPELKGLHISGAARWLTPAKAQIALSLRYRTNDHFWFTFFHEAAHLLHHGKRNIYLDSDCVERDSEEEADRFGGSFLIPDEAYRRFIAKGDFFQPQIEDFAARLGIHPGIVVGRLQHDSKIKYEWHNQLKQKIDPSLLREWSACYSEPC